MVLKAKHTGTLISFEGSEGSGKTSQIARLAGSSTAGGKVLDPHAALTASLNVFQTIGWVGVGFGALFLLGSPLARLWSHGVNDPLPEPLPAE